MQEIQKFNTGDIVRCITDNYLYFTCGKGVGSLEVY